MSVDGVEDRITIFRSAIDLLTLAQFNLIFFDTKIMKEAYEHDGTNKRVVPAACR